MVNKPSGNLKYLWDKLRRISDLMATQNERLVVAFTALVEVGFGGNEEGFLDQGANQV
jgi:hypothetical protein